MRTLSLSLLAEAIVSRRKALHITQAQLAERTGINRSVLSRMENGTHKPSLDQLEALAGVLGIERRAREA